MRYRLFGFGALDEVGEIAGQVADIVALDVFVAFIAAEDARAS